MTLLKHLAVALVASAALANSAHAANPASVVGKWQTPTRHGVVDIAPCGESICGRVVTSDGVHTNPDLRDVNNKDASKRNRRVKDLLMLGGFTREPDKWSGGWIYNAEDGGTYKATITPTGPNSLKLKGCIVWPLCKTQTWTRVP